MNSVCVEGNAKTGFLPSSDRTPLFYRHVSVSNKKASVLIVHGFGEHCGRYAHVIEALKKARYEVFCVDFRGHGHSKGARGDIKTFSLYEEDLLSALSFVKRTLSSQDKLFILAHSMGALISLRLMVKHHPHIAGMILSSPLLALKLSLPTWKRAASLLAARMAPFLRIKTGIVGVHLSSDHSIAQAYDSDPLVLKNLSVRAFREIYKGYQDAQSLAKAIGAPFFLQVAGDDPVVDSVATEKWFKHVDRTKVDATIKIYHGFLHEIYNEKNRSEPIADFISWLDARA